MKLSEHLFSGNCEWKKHEQLGTNSGLRDSISAPRRLLSVVMIACIVTSVKIVVSACQANYSATLLLLYSFYILFSLSFHFFFSVLSLTLAVSHSPLSLFSLFLVFCLFLFFLSFFSPSLFSLLSLVCPLLFPFPVFSSLVSPFSVSFALILYVHRSDAGARLAHARREQSQAKEKRKKEKKRGLRIENISHTWRLRGGARENFALAIEVDLPGLRCWRKGTGCG